ncbi:MAG: glutamine-hydrolyzing carbamoyl-phosphate synthase small subunit [Euryarchaeota archaeon]|nr:glutamine-hydrolyzing carbamoyl-phosphate synthase small subunit [Euryarchaeota archaeon]
MGPTASSRSDAVLVLEDGTILRGSGFGAKGTVFGELVFNTGMTGYQESLTDPSYAGQVLMFTYPMIGNYGVNDTDHESRRVWPRAVVVREHCALPSHRSATKTLHAFLEEQGVPGIAGIDTRALTVKTRERGCLRAFVSNEDPSDEAVQRFVREAKERPYPSAENLVAEVSTKTPLLWRKSELPRMLDETEAATTWDDAEAAFVQAKKDGVRTIVLYDYGVKWNIVRNLAKRFMVLQVPWDTPADRVLALAPDGLFLSNGPGDPAHPDIQRHPVPALQELVHKLPTWGICFGHQLLAHAFGGTTFKLPFGHRGANQPVRRTDTHDVIVTSQNHGFAVSGDGFEDPEVMVTEVNNNDGTVEALAHRRLPVRSCQYHPEASPGPKDASPLFDSFVTLVETKEPQAEARTILAGHLKE